jgi:drug/metabolite transporter (DMT)-like permease
MVPRMGESALGAVAAVTASALFSVGLVLQSLEARTIPAENALRLSLIGRLLGRLRWVVGGVLMLIGFGFHVGALMVAPLTVVQPSLAAGLLVLLFAGRRTDDEPIGARELGGVAAIALGLVGVALAAPARTTLSAGAASLALALGAVAALALLPHAVALVEPRHRQSGTLLAALGAGAAYALAGLTTKLLSDDVDTGDWLGAPLWLGLTALAGTVALVDQTTALQRGGPTQVGVIVYVMPVVVPVLLAPVLVGEDWSSSRAGRLPLGLSLAAVCAGAAVLAGSRPRGAQPAGSPRQR